MSQCAEWGVPSPNPQSPRGAVSPPVVARGVTWRTRVDATAASAGSGFKGE
ncbi:hypothetical protein [Fischerella thermalis]|uniref:hypothetical protein n=1 Tax=Fischerella thermalis TaxID=372787 RepID=UPI0015E132B7|nr:hypothetical protein [Fischerella thermalis]